MAWYYYGQEEVGPVQHPKEETNPVVVVVP